MCAAAAGGGHIVILEWLREKGAKWDPRSCAEAAMRGHLDCLRWLIENECPQDDTTFFWGVKWGATSGCMALLEYLVDFRSELEDWEGRVGNRSFPSPEAQAWPPFLCGLLLGLLQIPAGLAVGASSPNPMPPPPPPSPRPPAAAAAAPRRAACARAATAAWVRGSTPPRSAPRRRR